MLTSTFLAFLAAAALLAVTPGPGMAYVVARTAAGGRAEGLASCLGTGLGGMVHVVAAALGLSALLAQSAAAFALVKWLGVAYLLWLGWRLLRGTTPQSAGAVATAPRVVAQGVRRALAEGVVVEALNVKTALFFVAFLPQFVDPAQALAPQLVLLGSLCVLLNTLADVVAVFAAARLMSTGGAQADRARWLRRASGGTMLGLGLWLALARREG